MKEITHTAIVTTKVGKHWQASTSIVGRMFKTDEVNAFGKTEQEARSKLLKYLRS